MSLSDSRIQLKDQIYLNATGVISCNIRDTGSIGNCLLEGRDVSSVIPEIDGKLSLGWSVNDTATALYLTEHVQYGSTVYSNGRANVDIGSQKYLVDMRETVQSFEVEGNGRYYYFNNYINSYDKFIILLL